MNALSFIIQAKDHATATLTKLKGQFGELKRDWANAMAGMKEGSYSGLLSFALKLGPVVAAVGISLKALGASLRWVGEGIQEVAKFETLTLQLSRVTGSVKLARAELKALTEGKYAVDDLFDEADIVAASISLKRLSQGVLGTAGDMHTIAEVATVTGQSLSEVASGVGMLISKLLAGDTAWSRFAMPMVRSGALSMQTVTQMQRMQTEGRAAGDIISYMWASLNSGNAGAVDQARKTVQGLGKAVDDARADAKRAWGEFFTPFQRGIDHARIAWFKFVQDVTKNPRSLLGGLGPIGLLMSDFLEGQNAKNKTPKVDEEKTSYKGLKAKAFEEAKKNGVSPDDFEKEWNDKQAAEKKAADDAVKIHDELLKKKEEAQQKYDDAQRTREEKVRKLQHEEAFRSLSLPELHGDNRIKSETRILEIALELKKLKKEIADEEQRAAETAASRAESLMQRDREIREAQFTNKQKREASQARVLELTAALATEKDPDKRFKLQDKLMTEAEKQQGLSNEKPQSMSIGDLFEVRYGEKGKKGKNDPANKQLELTERIVEILSQINKKPGGMGK